MPAPRVYWLVVPLTCVLAGGSRMRADEPRGFKDLPPRSVTVSAFSNAEVDDLLATLDRLLDHDIAVDPSGEDAANDLWTFRERLQSGRLDETQEGRVLEHLQTLSRTLPDVAPEIGKESRIVAALTVGKTAPDIVGKDLEGKPLKLSDYRGTVVVLTFSGEWCGSCRLEYPYQRLMQEVYKNRPLTLLSVDSDRDPRVPLKAKAERGLTYRSFWDGGGQKSTAGPIATAWGVMGWPTTYLIDQRGVIRFVNLRQEDMLKAVKQLMSEVPN